MEESKKQILVVDDEEEICDFLKEELEKGPYGVDVAFTGEDALKYLARKPYDLALIDLKLSTATTGLDLIRECRQTYPSIKLIAMTGYVDMKLQEEVMKYGVSDYLEKPSDVHPDVVYKRVEKALRGA